MSDITWTPTTVTLGALVPWERNPKRMSKAAAARLLANWQDLGQWQTLAVGPNGEVYDGHQRLSALLRVHGKGYEVQALQASRALTDDERARLVIEGSASAVGNFDWDALAGWDAGALQGFGFDGDLLAAWNDQAANLRELLESEKPESVEDAGAQVDKAEELREKWGVESGQLWQLGEHRLICGDCTDKAVVERVMGGERAQLAPVDPPYNVSKNYDGETVDDTKTVADYEAFSRAWFGLCQSVSDRQIVTPGCDNLALWERWFDSKHVAPWTKSNSMTNGRVTRFWCWEPVMFYGDKWKRTRPNDIFDYPIGQQKEVANHPCPKPLAMWLDLVENYSELGDVIYEAFSGSGTTLIACERLGRKCRAIEISPAYCAVAIERWAQTTGGTPVLLNDSEIR